LFGAHEVLTDWDSTSTSWVATLISRGRDLAEARAAAADVRAAIAAAYDLRIRGEAGDS